MTTTTSTPKLVLPGSPAAAVAAGLRSGRRDVTGVLFQIFMLLCLFIALGILVVLLGDVFADGLGTLVDRGPFDFVTTETSGRAAESGIFDGVFGSFWILVCVAVVSFPLGLGAAVYLEEYARPGRLTNLVQINVRNLAGVPAVVYGVFGLGIFVELMGGVLGPGRVAAGKSLLAGGLTMAVLVLPIVIITASEAIRSVPRALREAGYGVGATRWEVTKDHVLPYALPGILTGTVLSFARAIGETAPLIVVGALQGSAPANNGFSLMDNLQGRFTALPMQIYDFQRRPQSQGWAELVAPTIIVLLSILLVANAAAIVLRNRYERKREG